MRLRRWRRSPSPISRRRSRSGPLCACPGPTLAAASARDVGRFFLYAKPLVASFVLYALISLINRQVALSHLGAAETGKFALAFDLSQRLFQALYALPEIFLFQYALKRDREEGRAAAEAQIALNASLALAAFLPVAAGYFALGRPSSNSSCRKPIVAISRG